MFTEINPQPNIPKLEEEVLQFWLQQDIFKKSLEKNQGKERFVFFEGPPTANGRPGLHHMEARAFKDVILRFQTMLGKYVLRKAGWDTHGLPVELEVEKSLGISGKRQIENLVRSDKRASIEKFNKLCRESVWKYKDGWEHFTRRMGFWIDLVHPYITYENSYIETVWWLVQQISKKHINGKPLLYEGHKVLPYCPRCGTALSSHEVALGYKEVEDTSVYVRFLLTAEAVKITGKHVRPQVVALNGPTYFLSWTTTPWTLPGNVALAVGENIEYSLVRFEEQQYIVASALVEKVFSGGYQVITTLRGRSLVGLGYQPLFEVAELAADTSYRVYPARFVTTDEGTGIVHTAVMYGEDDYELGTAVGLPKFHTVNEEGFFVPSVPGLAGKYVKEAGTETLILKFLKKKNALFKTRPYRHDYPFCWRCGTALLYYARHSWFIRMSALARQLQKNNEQITWVPSYFKHGRFGEWLAEVKDWAISRERYWGTPLPFWRCDNETCRELAVIGSLSELRQRSTAAAAQPEDVELHRPYVDEITLKCVSCSSGTMRRVPEVLDVWFDSGAMPYAQWHYPFENQQLFAEQFPADYIAEAVDQTRGWFYTLLAVATALGEKQPPYRAVMCLGHVLDEQGQKMSKSRGNVVEPLELMDTFGADIVRWYMFSVNQPGDSKRFTPAELTRMQRKVQIILWNVYNYFITYARAVSWRPLEEEVSASINILDRWIMARLVELVGGTTGYLLEYNAFRAARQLEEFITDLSRWYIRRSRGRTDSSFFATLFHVLMSLAKLLAPFMPFFADSLYRNLRPEAAPPSVHLTDWPPTTKLSEADDRLIAEMREIHRIVEAVLAWRKRAGLKVRQPLSDLFVKSGNLDLHNFTFLLREELNFVNIHIGPEPGSAAGDWVRVEAASGVHPDLYINPQLTPELRAQGLARDMERHVQELRKAAGLQVGQQILMYYETASQELYEAFEYFDQSKTYISRIVGARQPVEFEKDITVGGHKLWVGFKKLSAP